MVPLSMCNADVLKNIQKEALKKKRMSNNAIQALNVIARCLRLTQPAVKTDLPGYVQVTLCFESL